MVTTSPARRHLTPSLVLSAAALFVALGGTGYALSIPRGSVGAAQLRAGAVTSRAVANGSLQAEDLQHGLASRLGGAAGAPGPAGPAGPPGPAGPAGPRGSARAYAFIGFDATLLPGSTGVASVTQPVFGTYCIGLDPSINAATAVPVATVGADHGPGPETSVAVSRTPCATPNSIRVFARWISGLAGTGAAVIPTQSDFTVLVP